MNLLLGNISQTIFVDKTRLSDESQTSYNPFFQYKHDMISMQMEVSDLISHLNTKSEDSIKNSSLYFSLPDACLTFNQISYFNQTLSYSYIHNDNSDYQRLRRFGTNRKILAIKNSLLSQINTAFSKLICFLLNFLR